MTEADPDHVEALSSTVELTAEERSAFREAVARGLAQGEAGEVVGGDSVFRWLESWGSKRELPPPVARKGN